MPIYVTQRKLNPRFYEGEVRCTTECTFNWEASNELPKSLQPRLTEFIESIQQIFEAIHAIASEGTVTITVQREDWVTEGRLSVFDDEDYLSMGHQVRELIMQIYARRLYDHFRIYTEHNRGKTFIR